MPDNYDPFGTEVDDEIKRRQLGGAAAPSESEITIGADHDPTDFAAWRSVDFNRRVREKMLGAQPAPSNSAADDPVQGAGLGLLRATPVVGRFVPPAPIDSPNANSGGTGLGRFATGLTRNVGEAALALPAGPVGVGLAAGTGALQESAQQERARSEASGEGDPGVIPSIESAASKPANLANAAVQGLVGGGTVAALGRIGLQTGKSIGAAMLAKTSVDAPLISGLAKSVGVQAAGGAASGASSALTAGLSPDDPEFWKEAGKAAAINTGISLAGVPAQVRGDLGRGVVTATNTLAEGATSAAKAVESAVQSAEGSRATQRGMIGFNGGRRPIPKSPFPTAARTPTAQASSVDPSLQEIQGVIQPAQKPRMRLPTALELKSMAFDDKAPIEAAQQAYDQLSGVQPLSEGNRPFEASRRLKGLPASLDEQFHSGIRDINTDRVVAPGPSQIRNYIEPGQIPDLEAYMVAKHALDREEAGHATPLGRLSPDVAQRAVDAVEANHPNIVNAAKVVQASRDAVIDQVVASGRWSPEQGAALKSGGAWENYISNSRAMSDEEGLPITESTGAPLRSNNMASSPNLVRKMGEGSTEGMLDAPLATTLKGQLSMMAAAQKNRVLTNIADIGRPSPQAWAEANGVPPEFAKDPAHPAWQQYDADVAPYKAMDEWVKPADPDHYLPGERTNLVKYFRNGQEQHLEVHPSVLEAVKGLGADTQGTIGKLLSIPSNVLRAGVTLDPAFAAANLFRDALNASVISRYGGLPFSNIAKGVMTMVGRPDLASDWRAAGGDNAFEMSYIHDPAKLIRKLSEDPTMAPWQKTLATIRDPSKWTVKGSIAGLAKAPGATINGLQALSNLSERVGRLGEFTKVRDKLVADGMSIHDANAKAAFESRDMLDFAMGGSKTKALKGPAAFFGSAMSGLYREADALKNQPSAIPRALAYITAPTMVLYALNKDDPDYQRLPGWRKDFFWNVPLGKGHFMSLPIPAGLIGYAFKAPAERAMQFVTSRDPKAFDGMAGAVGSTVVPNPIPTAARLPLELSANYSAYKDGPIVSPELQRLPASEQYNDRTSLTARAVGSATGFSPQKIDYAARSTMGGLGRQATTQISDRAIHMATGEPMPAGQGPVKRFFTGPEDMQSEQVNRFYGRLDELRKQNEATKQGRNATETPALLDTYEQAARDMSEIRQMINHVDDPGDKADLYDALHNIADRMGEIDSSVGKVPR